MSNFPENSNFPFKIIVSFSSFVVQNPGILDTWNGLSRYYHCFVKLKPNISKTNVEKKIKELHALHKSGNILEERLFKLQPLSEIHQDTKFRDHNFKRSIFSNDVFLTLSLISIFLLLIVCINYNNMAIAMSSSRFKEIAIRKVIGSKRKHFIIQFFGESLILSLIALLLGLVSANILIYNYYDFFGLPSHFAIHYNFSTITLLIGFLIAINIFSSLYPSVVISGFKPVQIFRKKTVNNYNRNHHFTKSTVLIQFIIAQIMIVGAILIYKQLHFINNTDIGFKKDGIVTVMLPDNSYDKMKRFAHQLKKYPDILDVSFSSSSPATESGFGSVEYFGKAEKYKIITGRKFVDESYISTYELELLHGRNFSKIDTSFNIIVNEEFVKEIGFANAKDALGEKINFGIDATIIGIVKDFNANSLHEKVRPYALINHTRSLSVAGIKFNSQNHDNKNVYSSLNTLIKRINTEWKDVYHGDDFEFHFIDDVIAEYYETEYKFASLVQLFTLLIILICCLGILGLSFYNIKRKFKEIAIKKVNGANVPDILSIFTLDYLKLTFFSLLISSPIAFLLLSKWLENFAYKTTLSWWTFALAGIFSLLIAWITIFCQSWKAATRNPVEALRYE